MRYTAKPMKLAVLADIHANLAALEVVIEHVDAWQPDAVVVAGDIVNRGTRPLECLRLVQERERSAGWLTVLGNHEEYVIAQSRPDAPRAGPVSRSSRPRSGPIDNWGATWVRWRRCRFSRRCPSRMARKCASSTPRYAAPRDGIFPDTPDDVLIKQIGRPHVPLFCVGHTHVPLVRRLDATLVVNVGAVGMPFDGDRRASYGQLTWQNGQWRAEIIRLPYDWARAELDYDRSGFIADGGPLAQLMLVELQRAQSQLYGWTNAYERAVLDGSN